MARKSVFCKHGDNRYMGKINDITGQRYGRLVVKEKVDIVNNRSMWKCLCDCGNEKIVRSHDLQRGSVKSCGCLRKEAQLKSSLTHGLSKTRIHKEWRGILHRCKNPTASHYENYGGRGIGVCEDWKNDFISFYTWSMQNGYDDKLTLDRIDNDKGYSPDNCRWVTHMENCHNRGARKDSETGVAGVTIRTMKSGKVWYRVHITKNYNRIYIGKYDTLEEAITERKKAEETYWGKKVV